MSRMYRRHALSLLTAGTAFLAGCSGSADKTASSSNGSENGSANGSKDETKTELIDNELPSYAPLLPETKGSPYLYGAISFDATLQRDNSGDGSQPTDPLIVNPLSLVRLSSFALVYLRNSAAIDAFRTHGTTTDSSTFVYADGVYAITGTYDRSSLAADLEAAGYDQETVTDTYAVYSDSETGDGIGVTDEMFAYAHPREESTFDPVDAVNRTVETAAGQRPPKYKTDDDFARLLRAGDVGDISLGLYTADTALTSELLESELGGTATETLTFRFDAVEGAAGVHQQLSVADGGATANAVVTYRDDTRVDVDRLESSFGTNADTVETSRNGMTVAIDAAYDDTVVKKT